MVDVVCYVLAPYSPYLHIIAPFEAEKFGVDLQTEVLAVEACLTIKIHNVFYSFFL